MKRTFLIALMVSLAMTATAQSQSAWADRAYSYMEQDSLMQAEECFKRAIEAASESRQKAMLLTNLGAVQRQRGKIHEAIKTYSTALEHSPLATPILMNRAEAYLTLGNDDKAFIDLCNVLDKNPNHAEAL